MAEYATNRNKFGALGQYKKDYGWQKAGGGGGGVLGGRGGRGGVGDTRYPGTYFGSLPGNESWGMGVLGGQLQDNIAKNIANYHNDPYISWGGLLGRLWADNYTARGNRKNDQMFDNIMNGYGDSGVLEKTNANVMREKDLTNPYNTDAQMVPTGENQMGFGAPVDLRETMRDGIAIREALRFVTDKNPTQTENIGNKVTDAISRGVDFTKQNKGEVMAFYRRKLEEAGVPQYQIESALARGSDKWDERYGVWRDEQAQINSQGLLGAMSNGDMSGVLSAVMRAQELGDAATATLGADLLGRQMDFDAKMQLLREREQGEKQKKAVYRGRSLYSPEEENQLKRWMDPKTTSEQETIWKKMNADDELGYNNMIRKAQQYMSNGGYNPRTPDIKVGEEDDAARQIVGAIVSALKDEGNANQTVSYGDSRGGTISDWHKLALGYNDPIIEAALDRAVQTYYPDMQGISFRDLLNRIEPAYKKKQRKDAADKKAKESRELRDMVNYYDID